MNVRELIKVLNALAEDGDSSYWDVAMLSDGDDASEELMGIKIRRHPSEATFVFMPCAWNSEDNKATAKTIKKAAAGYLPWLVRKKDPRGFRA